ncbi:MAG: alpha/beta hydrolase family esterase [bacterium]
MGRLQGTKPWSVCLAGCSKFTLISTLSRLLLVIWFPGALVLPARAQNTYPVQAGKHELSLKHAGRKRFYTLHVPKTFDRNQPAPLVIVLHGGAGNADNAIRMTGMSAKADEEGFLAVYPQGTGRLRKHALTWNAANCCGYAHQTNIDDVGFIRALLDTLQAHYKIDPKRIYATGMSNGGMLVYRLACELADKLAAIAPVAAAFNDTLCQPSAPVSVIVFHGTLDKRVPFKGGTGEEAPEKRIDRSVAATIEFWVDHNSCEKKSGIESLTTTIRETFSAGRNDTEVVLVTIKGGGHAWPGGKKGYLFSDVPTRALSATDVMWEFFEAHPREGTGKQGGGTRE